MRVTFRIVCALLLLVGIATCKARTCDGEPPAHPAEASAEEFLDALKYGDASRAAALHIESTDQGFYCQSDKFEGVLELAHSKRSPAECGRLDSQHLDDQRLDKLRVEARLLVQIVRFSCAHPQGGCALYGERVLESHLAAKLDASTFRWRNGDWTIRKVMGDHDEAVVYVELGAQTGQKAAFETLAMKRVGDQWFVAESFVDGDQLDQ
jgi:hypothetical protein